MVTVVVSVGLGASVEKLTVRILVRQVSGLTLRRVTSLVSAALRLC